MDPVTGISLARIVIGICAFVSPDLTAKVFGLSPVDNQHLPYMSRMFGAREVALGGVTLFSKGTTRRNLTLVGMAVDGADATTGALELQSRRITTTAGVMLIGVATSAVVSGGLALVRSRRTA